MSPNSLLKYDAPEIVDIIPTAKRRKLPVREPNPQQATVDFLDSLLPTHRYIEGIYEYCQHASLAMTTRSDVLKLEEQLDQLLKEKKARDKGICPIRHQLYEDCMNELIREVALELHERGILLRDLRDELNLTIGAYNALYESAVAQGIRKAIHGEQDKNDLKQKNDQLEAEIKAFQDKIAELNAKMEEAERSDQAEMAAKEKDHAEKVVALRAENQTLRQKLESMLVPLPAQ
jgi:dynein light intermediate chain